MLEEYLVAEFESEESFEQSSFNKRMRHDRSSSALSYIKTFQQVRLAEMPLFIVQQEVWIRQLSIFTFKDSWKIAFTEETSITLLPNFTI